MIVSFENEQLHDVCTSLPCAEEAYGSVHAGVLIAVISDAMSFENAADFVAYLDADAQISTEDSLLIAIGTGYQAALVAVGTRFDRDGDGRIIWATVTRLKLVEIVRVA